MESCSNCGDAIGKLETPHIWRDQIVCAACYDKLAAYQEKPGAPQPSVRAQPNEPAGVERIVTLNCENCGGKLHVHDNMEQFTCGYCGTVLIVQRSGGRVLLKRITEEIRKVQAGTDKTAAELAIARHEKELSELKVRQSLLDRRMGGAGCGIGCTGVLFLMALAALANGAAANGCGWTLAVFSALAATALVSNLRNQRAQRNALRDAIVEKRRQVSEKRQVADA